MATFKKSESVQGKWKALRCTENSFVDSETGEEVDVLAILRKQFTDNDFSLTASYKLDTELD